MKTKYLYSLIAVLLVLIPITYLGIKITTSSNGSSQNQTIIFIHGYGSSASATNALATQTKQDLGIKNRLKVKINGQGQNDLQSSKLSSSGNIIQLEFTDKDTSEKNESKYIATVTKILKAKGISAISLVGHSMGSNVALRYLETDGYLTPQYPTVNKLVAIAGPFNTGIDQPDEIRKQFKNNSIDAETKLPKFQDGNFKFFYKNKDNLSPSLQILNIYGDIGDGTDGKISNFSSESLNLLIKKEQPYLQLKVTGSQVQHSQIRTNPRVTKQVSKFLSNP
ncbi:alpha/beta hydrolase [Fructobacillus fructosus]|uniref:alpha/beta hydrolase n=1 Tax=Fructobacillus fructosus TaxID=1631 RepID=UPI0016588B61|nr:alpha/beta hydrolase [Fructobacillus fructosus]MBC9118639.1 alpha/beta hydrolase [Fructobacillus fructosus]MBD9365303.1 alpha/beta hydrolase [Leuconostoc mesenteroides]